MKRNKLTILILSFERQEELKKKIKYWTNIKNNFKILIIDGSSKPLKLKINKNKIVYLHFKSRDYHQRIFYALRYIKTDYFKLESDDDYFLPSSLKNAIDFLEKNKNYSAVYGEAGIYSIYKNKLYINHIFKKKLHLDSNDFKKRLISYFLNQNYSPKLYYSLMRTKFFKKNVILWKLSKKNYGDKFQRFAEIHLPLALLLLGKIKIINKIFWIRKDDDIQKRIEFTSNKRLIKNDHTYTNISLWYLKNIKRGYFNLFVNNLCKLTNTNKYYKKFITYDLLKEYAHVGIYKSKQNKKITIFIINILKNILSANFKNLLDLV